MAQIKYDEAWLAESRRRVYEGTPAERAEVAASTEAFKARMHRAYHEARGLAVCGTLSCEHPWAPR